VTNLVSDKVRDLADSLADLKVRLRLVLAGELAQLVAQSIGDVVRTLVAGRTGVGEFRPPRVSPAGREADPWDADEDEEFDDTRRYQIDEREEAEEAGSPAGAAAAPVAIAAAVHVVRWWLGRRGSLLTAIGAGLGVGLLGIAGGTVVRTALAILTAAADLLATTDGLDASAARLRSA
jgi:hypothetical protein